MFVRLIFACLIILRSLEIEHLVQDRSFMFLTCSKKFQLVTHPFKVTQYDSLGRYRNAKLLVLLVDTYPYTHISDATTQKYLNNPFIALCLLNLTTSFRLLPYSNKH